MDEALIGAGQPAPDFGLQSHLEPGLVRLSDYRGQVVVLAFYVLDFTGT